MSRAAVVLTHRMTLAAAARLLCERGLWAAPVTDALGRCAGVLSAADVLRWAAADGRPGAGGAVPGGAVWCDWQVVAESARPDEVGRHMRRDPVMVAADTPLADIAGALLGPGGGPVAVVDEARRPLGLVSSRDALAALVGGGRRAEAAPAARAPRDRRALPRCVARPAAKG